MTTITSKLEHIAPAKAQEMLSKNTTNRPVSKSTVATYADALRRGEWLLNGDSIRFDSNGNVIDGQHRLLAIVASGVGIDTFVTRGLAPVSFSTIDRGKKRATSDDLSIQGEKNATTLASAARAIVLIKVGYVGRGAVTSAQCNTAIKDHPSIRHWVSRFICSKVRSTGIPSSFVSVLTLASERHGEAFIEEFLTQVATGESLQKGMPAYVLRERFMTQNKRAGQMVPEYSSALIIKCVNAYTQRRNMGASPKFQVGEQFPQVA